MRRLLPLLACSLVLWTVVTQLNHALSDAQIYVFVGSLFVTFASLTQSFAVGFAGALLAGLILDANTPVAFGTQVVLLAATHVFVFRVRDRLPRHDTMARVIVAVLANLALFLVFSFTQLVRLRTVAAFTPRLLVDLVCSQIFLALIAPWYFALQARALSLARVERETFG